jgi:2-polyprenyl-3-methyl-5-hydroxy-6-metoxy-1,4-benzoquinol methylase
VTIQMIVDKTKIVKPYDYSHIINYPATTIIVVSSLTWNVVTWYTYVVSNYSTLHALLIILINTFIGWCGVDFLSGLLHGILDRLPINSGGQTIIGGHHQYPMNYELLSHHQLIGISYFFILPFLIMYVGLNQICSLSTNVYMGWWIIIMCLGLACGHSHLYCHRRKINPNGVPLIFRIGQDIGFFMHPHDHQRHHIDPNVCTGFFSQKMDWLTNWVLHPSRVRSIPPLTGEDRQRIVENYSWYKRTYMTAQYHPSEEFWTSRSRQLEIMDLPFIPDTQNTHNQYTLKDFEQASRQFKILHDYMLYTVPRLNEQIAKMISINRQVVGRKIKIQDCGCGHGYITSQLATMNPHLDVIGMDISQEAIDHCRSEYSHISNLSFKLIQKNDECEDVDIIVTTFTLHHMTDVQVLNFLKCGYTNAKMGMIIYDLQRSQLAPWLFCFIKPMVNRIFYADGITSIQKAFIRSDWDTFLDRSEINRYVCDITWRWPFVWQLLIHKKQL